MHSMQVSIRAQQILVLQMTNFAIRWRGTQKGYSATVGQQFFISPVETQSKLLSMLSRKYFLNPSHRQCSFPQQPSIALSTLIFLMRTLLLEWRWYQLLSVAAAAAKSCQTLCDPMDGSPPGSLVPGILQLLPRTLQTLRDTEPTAQGRVCYPRDGGGRCHHSAVTTLTSQGISTLTDGLVPDPQ